MNNVIKQGIVLAGGNGSRLSPLTNFVNKGLVGINGKFIIDYAIDILRQLGVQDLIVVLGGNHFSQIVSHIKNGKDLGFKSCSYVFQENPEGLSQAISLCEHLITDEQFYTILGDNIYDGPIKFDHSDRFSAQICLASHPELNRFGVASIEDNKIVSIQEKPQTIDPMLTHYAISGLYLFDHHFFQFFRNSKKSARGEYEIVDIMKQYQQNKELGYTIFDGMWADAGTHGAIKTLSDYFWQKGK